MEAVTTSVIVCQVIRKDSCWVRFCLHNLLLEIATIDRDEQPLRFDQKLRNIDYFARKTAQIAESKLRILFELLAEDNLDKAIDSITQEANNYQRIRIPRFDQGQ